MYLCGKLFSYGNIIFGILYLSYNAPNKGWPFDSVKRGSLKFPEVTVDYLIFK